MKSFAARRIACSLLFATLVSPASADSYTAFAGVYKFRLSSQEPIVRSQNQMSAGLMAMIDANYTIPANEWSVTGSGFASATAQAGRVEASGVADTNGPSGGTVASGSAWTDDFLVQHRPDMVDPGYEYVFGYLRITITFESLIALTNVSPGTDIFNSTRIEWSVLTRDMADSAETGWASRAGDGTSSGSPFPVVGSKVYDIPVSFKVGTKMAVNLFLKNETQALSSAGGQASVTSIGMLELGQPLEECGICAKRPAARLAVILPPEYRADSVKWNIVDGMYTPPGSIPCPSDLDGSGAVDTGDVALLLLGFGECAGGAPGCEGDLDGSGSVDTGDIGVLLLDMGDCP